MYILSASAISHQHSFQNNGYALQSSALTSSSELIIPDYSEFIPANDRRRMSEVLKMSITCAIDCLKQTGLNEPDAIIVGTSMGCSIHTKHFLDKIITSNEGLISPTAFIVSTHNTIAGQISLLLNSHGYNITHTQNSLSFEYSLIDAALCLEEGYKNILIGAADEKETTIFNMPERVKDPNIHFTSGAAFFIASNENSGSAAIRIQDVEAHALIRSAVSLIENFLSTNGLSSGEIDLVLYANTDDRITAELQEIFGADALSNYQNITGTYFTNSAIAMHYAMDLMQNTDLKRVLVCNNLLPENLGLILLNKESH